MFSFFARLQAADGLESWRHSPATPASGFKTLTGELRLIKNSRPRRRRKRGESGAQGRPRDILHFSGRLAVVTAMTSVDDGNDAPTQSYIRQRQRASGRPSCRAEMYSAFPFTHPHGITRQVSQGGISARGRDVHRLPTSAMGFSPPLAEIYCKTVVDCRLVGL